jgi:hypothetical protein
MAALTQNRSTLALSPNAVPTYLSIPIADNVHIFEGSIVSVDANGLSVPGGTAAATRTAGRAEAEFDNTGVGHAARAMEVRVRQGVFKFGNSSAADAIGQKDIGAACYVADDCTVALTNGSGTRQQAGTVVLVEADGVWVLMGIALH